MPYYRWTQGWGEYLKVKGLLTKPVALGKAGCKLRRGMPWTLLQKEASVPHYCWTQIGGYLNDKGLLTRPVALGMERILMFPEGVDLARP